VNHEALNHEVWNHEEREGSKLTKTNNKNRIFVFFDSSCPSWLKDR